VESGLRRSGVPTPPRLTFTPAIHAVSPGLAITGVPGLRLLIIRLAKRNSGKPETQSSVLSGKLEGHARRRSRGSIRADWGPFRG
jgi:hypothetical protein